MTVFAMISQVTHGVVGLWGVKEVEEDEMKHWGPVGADAVFYSVEDLLEAIMEASRDPESIEWDPVDRVELEVSAEARARLVPQLKALGITVEGEGSGR